MTNLTLEKSYINGIKHSIDEMVDIILKEIRDTWNDMEHYELRQEYENWLMDSSDHYQASFISEVDD